MVPNLTDPLPPRTLDLTGLPEPFVRQVEQLVRAERDKQAGPPAEASGSPVVQPTPDAGVPDWVSEEWPRFSSDPNPSPEESRRLLANMAAMGMGTAPSQPAD